METRAHKNRIIKLNVGGVKYYTYESTLLSQKQTFFTGLLSGNFEATKDEDGCIFIDRNGKYFEPILDYLRDGIWQCPSYLDDDRARDEAEFYGLTLPVSSKTLKRIHERKNKQRVLEVTTPELQQLAEDLCAKFAEKREIRIGPSFQVAKDMVIEAYNRAHDIPGYNWEDLESQYRIDMTYDKTLEVQNLQSYLREVHSVFMGYRSEDWPDWRHRPVTIFTLTVNLQ